VLLAFLTQLLIGLAFATPLFALTAFFQSESGFSLVFRLGMIPMFLFSGAFFPVSNLNPVLEAVAKVTPLWHGVDLTRMFTLGTVDGVMVLVHVLYLGTFAVVGFLLVVRLLARRLVS
jgi:lipooligosaccharide transport system permease protein